MYSTLDQDVVANSHLDSFGGKVLFITGGTGYFGVELVRSLIRSKSPPSKIVIFSRDEHKQFQMASLFKESRDILRFILGDVRDQSRLQFAMNGVDIVIHAAALKHVSIAEYNPTEYINTNILGTNNVVISAILSGVTTLITLSTDKASAPANLYGATKLCADKLVAASQSLSGSRNFRAHVVRYGNVFGSRGSVVPLFHSLRCKQHIPVTSLEMTRFSITLSRAIELVALAAKSDMQGEIFVPKIPSYRLEDLIDAMDLRPRMKIVGMRIGEKLHEQMISVDESNMTLECGDHYVICSNPDAYEHYSSNGAKPVKQDFSYTSLNNSDFMTVAELREQYLAYVSTLGEDNQ